MRKSEDCPPSKPWGCFKDDDGSKAGCHETRAAAVEQQRALYAQEAAKAFEVIKAWRRK